MSQSEGVVAQEAGEPSPVAEPAQEVGDHSKEPVQEVGDTSKEPDTENAEPVQESGPVQEAEQPPEPEGDPPELDDLSDEVDVRAYEDDPDPDEEYDEDGGFVIKDVEVEAVLETELVLHAAAEITVRNVLPDGAKRTRRAPQRYEPVETPTDDIDRPVKRRKLESTPIEDSEEEDEDEDDDEEYDEENESEESTDSESEDDDDPIEILE